MDRETHTLYVRAHRGIADEGDAEGRHEHGRNHSEQIGHAGAVVAGKIDAAGPEGEDREGLVAPCEVAPEHVEIDVEQEVAEPDDGESDEETLHEFLLAQADSVGDDEAEASHGGVARSDGGCDHAENSEDAAESAEPLDADFMHEDSGVLAVRGHVAGQFVVASGESDGSGRPDQGHDTLGDHRAVEHHAAVFLILEATGHHRALRGVEAGNGTAGDRDAHHREYRGVFARGMATEETFGESVGDLHAVYYHIAHDAHGHEEESEAEERVEVADQFVDGEEGGQDVIEEDAGCPERGVEVLRGEGAEEVGRSADEDGDHHHEEHACEDAHHDLDLLAELRTDDFGERFAAEPQGDHARHEVVDGSGEDSAEHNPEERGGAVHNAHYSAEDRADAGDVEKLDKVDFPGRHRHIVDAVGHCRGRRGAIGVGLEDSFHETAIDEVARYESYQSYYE